MQNNLDLCEEDAIHIPTGECSDCSQFDARLDALTEHVGDGFRLISRDLPRAAEKNYSAYDTVLSATLGEMSQLVQLDFHNSGLYIAQFCIYVPDIAPSIPPVRSEPYGEWEMYLNWTSALPSQAIMPPGSFEICRSTKNRSLVMNNTVLMNVGTDPSQMSYTLMAACVYSENIPNDLTPAIDVEIYRLGVSQVVGTDVDITYIPGGHEE